MARLVGATTYFYGSLRGTAQDLTPGFWGPFNPGIRVHFESNAFTRSGSYERYIYRGRLRDAQFHIEHSGSRWAVPSSRITESRVGQSSSRNSYIDIRLDVSTFQRFESNDLFILEWDFDDFDDIVYVDGAVTRNPGTGHEYEEIVTDRLNQRGSITISDGVPPIIQKAEFTALNKIQVTFDDIPIMPIPSSVSPFVLSRQPAGSSNKFLQGASNYTIDTEAKTMTGTLMTPAVAGDYIVGVISRDDFGRNQNTQRQFQVVESNLHYSPTLIEPFSGRSRLTGIPRAPTASPSLTGVLVPSVIATTYTPPVIVPTIRNTLEDLQLISGRSVLSGPRRGSTLPTDDRHAIIVPGAWAATQDRPIIVITDSRLPTYLNIFNGTSALEDARRPDTTRDQVGTLVPSVQPLTESIVQLDRLNPNAIIPIAIPVEEGAEESLEWLTSMAIAYDGVEQRRGLRSHPRRRLSYTYSLLTPDEHSRFAGLMGHVSRQVRVPVWSQAARITDVQNDSNGVRNRLTIAPHSHCHFRVGDTGFVCDLEERTGFHVRITETAFTNRMTTDHEFDQDTNWTSARYRFVPGTLAYLQEGSSIDMSTTYGQAKVIFAAYEDSTNPPITSEAGYNAAIPMLEGTPVVPKAPIVTEGIKESYTSNRQLLDSMTGKNLHYRRQDNAKVLYTYTYRVKTDQEKLVFFNFLDNIQGRHRSFWVPTWREDYIPTTYRVEAGTTILDLEHHDIIYRTVNREGQNAVQIQYEDGTIVHRIVTTYTADKLVLRDPLPSGYIDVISRLDLCRLNEDNVRMVHHNTYTDIKLPVRTIA